MQRLDKLQENKKTLIIAHRGAWGNQIRENTLEAFEKAIAIGADAVEFDVRRTADGMLVIHHDEKVSGADRLISQISYQENLALAKNAGYHLPTLRETVDLCHKRIAMDVELKEAGYEKAILDLVWGKFDRPYVIFKSFLDVCIKNIKEADPLASAGLLIGLGGKQSIRLRFSGLFPLKRLKACGANFVCPNWKLLKFGFLQRMKNNEVPVIVWTVDDFSFARRLFDEEVAGFTTNLPEGMLTIKNKSLSSNG